jgi:hypothetical protein
MAEDLKQSNTPVVPEGGGTSGKAPVGGKGRPAGATNGEGGKSPGAPAIAQKSFLPDIHLEMPPWLAHHLQPRLPGLAVLFQRDGMVLVHVERGTGGAPPVVTHASHHPLPEGSLIPGLTEANFKAPAEASARLGRALDVLPNRRKLSRVSLVIPDACARVILLDLATVPRGHQQLNQVVRWQIRKRVPFPLDTARLSMQRFLLPGGGERVAVVLGMERILSQYEQIAEALGLKPGLVDLATFNMANQCLLPAAARQEAEAGDVAVLNVADEEFSILILRQRVPLFYRSKPLLHHPEREPEACLRDVHRELITSAAYYRDRLDGAGQGLNRVWLRIAGGQALSLTSVVKETLAVSPQAVDVGGTFTMAGAGASTNDLETMVPALGATVGRWT